MILDNFDRATIWEKPPMTPLWASSAAFLTYDDAALTWALLFRKWSVVRFVVGRHGAGVGEDE